MSDRKRPFDTNGDATSGGTAKKLKSDTQTTNEKLAAVLSSTDVIAQKRAEIAAKLLAMKNTTLGARPSAPISSSAGISAPVPIKVPPPSLPRLGLVPTPSPTVSSGPTPSTATGSPAGTPSLLGASTDDLNRRVAEAKRRVAEAQSKLAVKDNPYMSMPQTGKGKNRPVEQTQQGAGLKMAAHPLLLDTTPAAPQSKKDRYKPMQPKFASIKANTRNAPTPPPPPPPVVTPDISNPYAAAARDTGFEGAPRDRSGRNFRFNPKGKYVALGNQMRQENQLEALKQRIAESARKAGLDGEMGVEKGLKRGVPPVAEWWDAALLPNKTYDDLQYGIERMNIRTADSPITIYIQHPIPIPAPSDKNKIELKPLMLTTKEQKKMRRRKRQDAQRDKMDRIKMGLLPPDPPKVRLANLMKVLTSDAVQDPTRVEARVRRDVAMRKHGHEKMNAERKLTDEQRREKIEAKKAEEEKKGIHAAVFKIKTLTDPAHRFKVRKNAEQNGLTGVCIHNPQFSVVYVEGASKFIKNYKKLMLRRIAWTEAARPRGVEDVEIDHEGSDDEEGGSREGAAGTNNAAGEASTSVSGSANATIAGEGDVKTVSLEDNKCFLVWEGQVRERSFGGFMTKVCPTDRDAKEVLGERLRGYWDQAKNWKPEEEDVF